MGCLRLTYQENGDANFFQGLWKKSGSGKNCDNYYAFGLTFNSYQRENSTENRYLYNQGTGEKTFKTERVYELGLNVDQSKYRTYDYITGRWWQVDPLSDSLVSKSPYTGMDNNPIRYNDPYGDCPSCVWGAIIGASVEYASQVVGNVYKSQEGLSAFTKLSTYTNVDVSDIIVSSGVGAATGGLSTLTPLFTKTAIVGGVATVGALGEGVKAAVDVNVTPKSVNVTSVFEGGKSKANAAVEFVVGNIPTPSVVEGPIKSGAEAAAQSIVNTIQSFFTEWIEKVTTDKLEKKKN